LYPVKGTTRPMITGPRLDPRSEIALKVPTAGPSAEPAYSRAYAIEAGKKKALPAPHIIPTRIKRESVLEKESIIIETVAIEIQTKMIFSLSYASTMFPAKILPAISTKAFAVKK